MAQVYRLILFVPRPGLNYPEGGSYDTGGTYSGCSHANPNACKAQQFAHLKDAVDFAYQSGEIPVKVQTVDDVWKILDGEMAITDSMIVAGEGEGLLDSLPIGAIAIGIGALFVLPKLLRKHHAS